MRVYLVPQAPANHLRLNGATGDARSGFPTQKRADGSLHTSEAWYRFTEAQVSIESVNCIIVLWL